MRTNIDIDDKLMKAAMKATGARTKKATVEVCLRKMLEVRAYQQKMDEMFRRQELARREAEREGRLDEWHAELLKNGNSPEV